MLLSDSKVSEFLKTEVVPAWETVRPTAKVSIDFGNGKKLERTLKGNTVLYLCTPSGQVVDAFPGVYTPDDFIKQVQPALERFGRDDHDFRSWHKAEAERQVQAETARVMMAKAFVESPLLDALGVGRGKPKAPKPNEPTDDYSKIVTKLHDMSDAPASPRALRNQVPKRVEDDPERMADWVLKKDSSTNVKLLRPAVHMLLSTQTAPTPKSLRDRIFKELLLVKIDDPYLGLGELAMPGTPKPKK